MLQRLCSIRCEYVRGWEGGRGRRTHGVGEDGHEMVENSSDLSKHGTDPLGTVRYLCTRTIHHPSVLDSACCISLEPRSRPFPLQPTSFLSTSFPSSASFPSLPHRLPQRYSVLTNVQQLLNGPRVAKFVRHHTNIIESIKVRQSLSVRLVLDQLLRPSMKESNVRVCTKDLLSVQLEDQAKNSVCCRMLRTCVPPATR